LHSSSGVVTSPKRLAGCFLLATTTVPPFFRDSASPINDMTMGGKHRVTTLAAPIYLVVAQWGVGTSRAFNGEEA